MGLDPEPESGFTITIGAKIITDRNIYSGQLFGDR